LRTVIFTDLDGTLLDAQTYSYEAARPALERIRQLGIPLILCSSKTRAEMEVWRERLGNRDPFIVENGGAAIFGDEIVVFGDSYLDLVAALRAAAEESGCAIRAFHELDDRQVSELTGLSLDDACRALAREYDEPFQIIGGEPGSMLAAIERRGKRWTAGGRFYHITGNNDKGLAVQRIVQIYRERHADLRTVGIGDSWNDMELLRATDLPIVLPSEQAQRLLAALPGARLAPAPGPAGWNAALLSLLAS
jgi:mannosyl-3-phosphoglycerate phosphatase